MIEYFWFIYGFIAGCIFSGVVFTWLINKSKINYLVDDGSNPSDELRDD